MLHAAEAEPLGVRDVRRGLLLRQDLAAAAYVRPLRLFCATRETGTSDNSLQGLFCPRHAQSGIFFKHLYLYLLSISRISATHQDQGWNIAGAQEKICVTEAPGPRVNLMSLL